MKQKTYEYRRAIILVFEEKTSGGRECRVDVSVEKPRAIRELGGVPCAKWVEAAS